MRVDVPPLEAIRAELGRIADLPRERSVTMPPAAYFSEEFLGHELREIFAKEWVCIGRVEEVAEPGDYFAFELVGESLLVVRGDDRVVRVLSNVCRHRWSQVASGQGNTRRFVCPYHAWTYDLEGSLVHTRFMESSQAFDPDCRLPRIATEIWQGFIYVNLDGEASPLAPRLAGLEARIGDYHMEEMVRFTGGDEVWDTNWKLLTENFTEAYHNPQTHKDSLEPVVPAELTSYPGGDAAYSFMVAQVNPDKPPRVPHHPDLSAKQQTEVSLAGVFPFAGLRTCPGTSVLHVPQPGGGGQGAHSMGCGDLRAIAQARDAGRDQRALPGGQSGGSRTTRKAFSAPCKAVVSSTRGRSPTWKRPTGSSIATSRVGWRRFSSPRSRRHRLEGRCRECGLD